MINFINVCIVLFILICIYEVIITTIMYIHINKHIPIQNINITYLDRLKQEHADLNRKVNKLMDFLLKARESKYVDPYQKELLERQLKGMNDYLEILNIRIKYEENIDRVKREKQNHN